jgi:TRAP-type C4-dicarboxylate transport system permease small subunit
MGRISAALGAVSDYLGYLSAALLFAAGLILSYEVAARYFFSAPTIWVQDYAITMQVWFTYMAMAYVLRSREMIRITAVVGLLGTTGRKLVEAFTLLVIIAISILVIVLATDIVRESIALGRRQPTMLALPNWIVELPVVLGFILLALQAAVDLVRLPYVEAPAFRVEEFHK